MDKVKIFPAQLAGTVHVPSSKSMGHREIICAGLAQGSSIVDNISISKDIEATCRCLRAMGVTIEEVPSRFSGRTAFRVTGTGSLTAAASGADCGESGSTLRFFVPLGASLNAPFTFTGHGKLVSRPLQAYYDIFDQQGLEYQTQEGQLPLTVKGRLRPGTYQLPGDVSSQYVSGLLFALPLLEEDSVVEITSPLESAAYVDMTISCLQKYGVEIVNEDNSYRCFHIKGGQKYQAQSSDVEGDWSQIAFWTVGGALGQAILSTGVSFNTLQGDKAVLDIMERMGAAMDLDAAQNTVKVSSRLTHGTVIDASNCPDIIPVLTVLAAVSQGKTEIINAGRLRIKECDRLAAITQELNKCGAKITELAEGLIIEGRTEGLEGGAEVDAWNDHRIAMSLAIAAQSCKEPIILTGAASVAKSYPLFWEDYRALGGRLEVLG